MSGTIVKRSNAPAGGRGIVAGMAAALVAMAAGCSNQSVTAGARLAGPADVVVFRGVTTKNPGLHEYLAVASSRSDSLALIDPVDDQPVLSPIVAYPLSIPTDPRPIRLAAAPLGDGGADLLVATSAGSVDLQVVETWTATNRVVPSASVSLAPLIVSGSILAIGALTPATASATNPVARVLVAVTGGRLIVVDFARDPVTGGVLPVVPVGAAGPGSVQTLTAGGATFDALAIAMEPAGQRAFLATRDPLVVAGATVHGIAFADAGGDPTVPWTITALDAAGPTTALAVGLVRERQVDSTNPAAPGTFDADPKLRIYAVIDPDACGTDRDVACGIAMLDDHGLLPDPAGELPYRAPLAVPGLPTEIAIAYPPATGFGRVSGDANNPNTPLLVVQPNGANTAAVGAVTSSDGNVYLFDLSRYAPVLAASALAGTNGISGAASVQPADVGAPGTANFGKDLLLGLWNDFPVPPSAGTAVAVSLDPALLVRHVQVTPGYTSSDTWLVTWQGELPALASRPAVVGRTPAGDLYVAFQANAGTTAQPVWISTIDVADPALGVHGGDLAVFAPDNVSVCPATDPAHPLPELVIDGSAPFLPADAAQFPGGALRVGSGSCFDVLAPGQVATGIVTVRASGLVLTSNQLGYLGRPVLDQPFVLRHEDERTATGEALAISRKIRRLFYPVEPPCSPAPGQPAVPGCYPGFPLIADPLAPGPVIGFRVGLVPTLDPSDPTVLQRIPRDARLVVVTITGMTPTGNVPINGGVLPSRMVSFDRSVFPGHENTAILIYALYRDDQLLEFSPSVVGGGRVTVR